MCTMAISLKHPISNLWPTSVVWQADRREEEPVQDRYDSDKLKKATYPHRPKRARGTISGRYNLVG